MKNNTIFIHVFFMITFRVELDSCEMFIKRSINLPCSFCIRIFKWHNIFLLDIHQIYVLNNIINNVKKRKHYILNYANKITNNSYHWISCMFTVPIKDRGRILVGLSEHLYAPEIVSRLNQPGVYLNSQVMTMDIGSEAA